MLLNFAFSLHKLHRERTAVKGDALIGLAAVIVVEIKAA